MTKYQKLLLFQRLLVWKKFYLYAGLLDDISILKKAKNIYFEDSHFPFMEISEKDLKL